MHARFFSKRVRSERNRRAVVRYIDANAINAGVLSNVVDHELGSGRFFARGRLPLWLSSDWIEECALAVTGEREFTSATYLRAFGSKSGPSIDAVVELVEARMSSAAEIDPLDDLIGQTPPQVQRWMVSKAALADGHPLGLPVCGPTAVVCAVAQHVAAEGDWGVPKDQNAWSAISIAEVGLLSDLSGTHRERIGRLLDIGSWAIKRPLQLHRERLQPDRRYGARDGRIAQAALDPLV